MMGDAQSVNTDTKKEKKDNEQKDQFVKIPSIALPKGGGAIKGIDEKFSVNAVNGTASFSIPLPFSQARGASPALSLSYNSGAGNGIFGLGWSLGLSTLKRKTDKELPKYVDGIDSDTYLFTGAEDLVPELEYNKDIKEWEEKRIDDRNLSENTYRIKRYRPRIEGSFARIERWTDLASGEIKWRVITKENITMLYGWTNQSRLVDPADPNRIFEWHPEFVFDDKGNCSHYVYKKEDDAGFDPSSLHNRNRLKDGKISYTNLYLEKIYYGKKPPSYQYFGDPFPEKDEYLFETMFDYGEYNPNTPYERTGDWEYRPDAFSEYKAGFEIRTTRLCKRVLLFHVFDELAIKPDKSDKRTLIKSVNFGYDNSTEQDFTFLKSITSHGYIKKQDGSYSSKQLPPLEFEYQKHEWNANVENISADNLVHAPSGLDEQQYQFTDLFNEGLSGILTEQANGWYYKHNLGEGKFEQAKLVSTKPSFTGLGNQLQLVDLDADGGKQLASLNSEPKGFFELSDENLWLNFKHFDNLPNINLRDANTRMIDLNGDGKADLLITEDNVFTCYESAGRKGFVESYKTVKPFNEEAGPHIVFSDPTQSIFLADMSGDGMTDIVRIRNGEVCYWPNLGYGKFGKKVGMDHAPVFDHPDSFNPSYLRLADIDGSGTTDIIYLGKNKFSCWMNLSGNSFRAKAFEIGVFPEIHNQAKISVTDLLGNGVASIVWSSNLSKDAQAPLKYIDLMNSKKPHIMVSYKNNLGKEVSLEYAPSAKFYLEDKKAGKPWITKLHFPVHCLVKVKIKDKWRNSEFTNSYSYHHGYYDHAECEFRGFGRVEQVDTELFGEFTKRNASGDNISDDHTLYQPPVKTITWHHTGAFLNREKILSQFSEEYFPNWFEALRPDEENVLGSFRENKLPEPDLEGTDLTTEEWREALRACKGMMLRQEVYELDVDALAVDDPLLRIEIPVKLFTTAYHNCHIKHLQPRDKNRYAIFHVTESEAITYHYELDLRKNNLTPDPRIAHTLNLKTDEYGNLLQSVAVVYPCIGEQTDSLLSSGELDLINRVQKEMHLSYSENFYTNDVDDEDNHTLRLICEANTYELTGVNPETDADKETKDPWDNFYFSIGEMRSYRLNNIYQNNGKDVSTILYHEIPNNADPTKRIVEKVRTLYFNEGLNGPEPFETLNRRGISFETFKLAMTGELINTVFENKLSVDEWDKINDPGISGYLNGGERVVPYYENLLLPVSIGTDTTGQYWICSGIAGFADDAKDHFCLPERYIDPFGNETILNYDLYDLYIKSSTDPLENTVSVESFDYRVLQPSGMKDINNNISEILFDALGMPIAMALKGKGTEGDNLDGYDETIIHPSLNSIINFFSWNCEEESTNTEDYLEIDARKFLGNATARYIYYLGEKMDGDTITWENHPACACDIVRERHVARLNVGEQSPIQMTFEYSDGMGTVLVKKIQAEPDPETGAKRWIASGKTILNNKGKPVKQYEPYFCDTHCFEEAVKKGVATIMYYDAPGRLVRTVMPDKSYSRVEFSPWFVANSDQNDTLLEPGNGWYNKNIATLTTPESKKFAENTAVHANTPQVTYLDSLGREVISIEHNKCKCKDEKGVEFIKEEKYLTFKKLDAEGKPLWICDARKNLVMQYIYPVMLDDYMHDTHDPKNQFDKNKNEYAPCYDITGNLLFQHSMDAGDRWILNDAAGKPMFAWDFYKQHDTEDALVDERRHYTTNYDDLHRPIKQWIRINEENEQLIEQFIYGEKINNAHQLNLRGQLCQHYDQSGLITNQSYDFKGNLLEVQKQLTSEYKVPVIDWKENSPTAKLEEEIFIQQTEYDALNRVSRLFNWHHGINSRVAVHEPHYNPRGLLELEKLVVKANKIQGGNGYIEEENISQVTTSISGITYDAKGQRQKVKYGNGTITRYHYDEQTFRLLQLRTTRPEYDDLLPKKASGLKDENVLQNLYYTYDPVGNITAIIDDAYEPVFFKNQKVEPESQYTYDALYRLVSASGREHYQNKAPAQKEPEPAAVPFPIDAKALRNYDLYYDYDAVGNISEMQHVAKGGSWTRRYSYSDTSNRLLQTIKGNGDTETVNYKYDSHGNMLNLADTDLKYYMHWDYRDMISNIDLGGGGFVFYNYDSEKQRSRKVIEDRTGIKQSERIYLGGLEIYRKYNGTGIVEEIESIHLMDGDHRFLLVEDVLKSNTDKIYEGILYRYQYNNHLGSAVLELDKNAFAISYEEYHPYGTTAYQTKNSEIKAAAKRYHYTGKERDEESGLYYNESRYYAPWLGRWVSYDSIGLDGGINGYRYVQNNPLIYIDENGMKEDELDRNLFVIQNDLVTVGSKQSKKEKSQAKSMLPQPNQIGETEFKQLQMLFKRIQAGNTTFRFNLEGMTPEQGAQFKRGVMKDIAIILQTKVGRELLTRLSSSMSVTFTKGETATYLDKLIDKNSSDTISRILNENCGGKNCFTYQALLQAGMEFGENYHSASFSLEERVLKYRPGEAFKPVGANRPWMPIRSDITLFHELVHSWWAFPGESILSEEQQTVGIGKYKDSKFTENKYRAERARIIQGRQPGDITMPQRDSYNFPIDINDPVIIKALRRAREMSKPPIRSWGCGRR